MLLVNPKMKEYQVQLPHIKNNKNNAVMQTYCNFFYYSCQALGSYDEWLAFWFLLVFQDCSTSPGKYHSYSAHYLLFHKANHFYNQVLKNVIMSLNSVLHFAKKNIQYFVLNYELIFCS